MQTLGHSFLLGKFLSLFLPQLLHLGNRLTHYIKSSECQPLIRNLTDHESFYLQEMGEKKKQKKFEGNGIKLEDL